MLSAKALKLEHVELQVANASNFDICILFFLVSPYIGKCFFENWNFFEWNMDFAYKIQILII